MKLTVKNSQLGVLGVLLITTSIIGCQDPDYPAAQSSTTGYNTSSTRVLFVNATPDASSLDFQVENTSVGKLTSGASTSYVGLPLGAVSAAGAQIRIVGAGGTYGVNDISTKPAFLANTSYTYFVTDTINRPVVKNVAGAVTDVGGVRTLQVVDTLTAPAAGTAKVRFFNLAPDVASASARLISLTGTAAATLAGRAYRAAAATSLVYTRVPAGTYTVQLYAASTVPAALTTTPAASSTLAVGDGKIYTIYARGLSRTRTLSIGTVQHN